MTEAKVLSRGDQTRDALIRAALVVFGRSGFDAASTRAIAEAAGVNQALIGYHFGGKQGLYLGVFEHIIGQIREHMAPVAAQVEHRLAQATPEGPQRRALALEMMQDLFDAFNDMNFQHSREGWVRLILREQQDPTEAFQLLYDSILSRLMGLVTRLVALGSGLEQDSEACRIRAMMIFGQLLVFYTARGTASRHLGWKELNRDNLAALKRQFRIVLESQFPPGVPAV
ncbi:MAG: CerR family C-terminal domain-containing protein [Halieaceae bacterium]|jgi:AcrR family transcriptional regulator|nr:CerR family C-terminal domain-containing protein [Halieaceae bacterium]